jgi:hypothetical protein
MGRTCSSNGEEQEFMWIIGGITERKEINRKIKT